MTVAVGSGVSFGHSHSCLWLRVWHERIIRVVSYSCGLTPSGIIWLSSPSFLPGSWAPRRSIPGRSPKVHLLIKPLPTSGWLMSHGPKQVTWPSVCGRVSHGGDHGSLGATKATDCQSPYWLWASDLVTLSLHFFIIIQR